MIRWPFGKSNWREQIAINAEQIALNKQMAECIRNLLRTNESLARRIADLENPRRVQKR